ncbi:MAG: ribosomal protein, partial [Thermomicrobiales bacterium]|nr:ribosomal protein [Thermomicrobiales bacterium]
MGALPKQRVTRHRQGNRRRHDYLKNVPVLVACNTCGEPHVVHHVCPT